MAEKPRLKESDAIPSGVKNGKKRANGVAQGGLSQERPAKKPNPKPAAVFDRDENEEEFADEAALPSAQSLAEKLMAREDGRRALNFSKYELPRRDGRAEPQAAAELSQPEDARIEFDFSAPAAQKQTSTAQEFDFNGATRRGRSARRAPAPEPELEQENGFTFEQQPAPPQRERRPRSKPETPREEAAPILRQPEQKGDVHEFAFEEFAPQPAPSAPQPEPPQPAPREPEPPRADPVVAPPPWAAPEPVASHHNERDDFLKRISQQFEREFNDKFSQGGPLAGRQAAPDPRPPVPPDEELFRPPAAAPRQFINPAVPAQPAPEPEDHVAEDFLSRFQQDVREEETKTAEDFKETLAEKFMRERERYLKDLGISDRMAEEEAAQQVPQPEPPSPAVSPRRRLDFQILPELHMERPSEPPSRMHPNPAVPMTYTRAGTARPQQLSEDADEFAPGVSDPLLASQLDSKKSSEQLLLELGRRSRMRDAQAAFQPTSKQPPKTEQLQFRFETPEEQEKNRQQAEKGKRDAWPRRVVYLSAAAGLVAIALIAWVLITYLNLAEKMQPASQPESSVEAADDAGNMDFYESRTFESRGAIESAFIKKAGVTVKNADIAGYILIEGIDTAGTVRLEDLTVAGAVSLADTQVDALELHNVKAARVIVNTDLAAVTVTVTGSSDIEVLEIRTNASIGGDIPVEAPGIRDVLVRPREDGNNIEAQFGALSIRRVETEAPGAEATLRFADTKAESLSADGSLSLLGEGHVSSLVLGQAVGQGAGDTAETGLVSLLVKGVTVGSINVRSRAALNLNATVDQVFAASPVALGGDGSVGSLTINQQFGSGRLLVDIAGLTVQDVYVNAVARLNVTGSGRVNTITANESTYALGNKVNLLKVNANDVIYENEPDKIQTSSGVRPPQTKADNPNLDYDLGPSGAATDVSGEDLATTCGHPRQSGGFVVGDGSKDAPFEVSNAMQLAHVTLHAASHFVQTADIDISAESAFAGGFSPICSTDPFTGLFDGRGFGIRELRILSAEEDVGLFAKNKGTIRNVNILSGDISGNASTDSYVGAIAGYSYEGGVVQNCSNGAKVSGGSCVGGIVGFNFNSAKIRDCYNFARISGGDFAGGIVGTNQQGASVTGSYCAGRVDGDGDVGAVAGRNDGGVIANCYYLEDMAEFGIGSGDGTSYERTADEMAGVQIVADLAAGNEGTLWIQSDAADGYRYPVLKKPE